MRLLLFPACCVLLAAMNLACLWLFSQPVRPAPVVPPHSLEWRPDGLRLDGRLPMPPMHSIEPQQITL